jgi:hypothetical protein
MKFWIVHDDPCGTPLGLGALRVQRDMGHWLILSHSIIAACGLFVTVMNNPKLHILMTLYVQTKTTVQHGLRK